MSIRGVNGSPGRVLRYGDIQNCGVRAWEAEEGVSKGKHIDWCLPVSERTVRVKV